MYSYPYPRPGLTVDALVFQFINDNLNLLLIQRADAPFKDFWALPGGFVDEQERVEDAIIRELKEETNIGTINLIQLYVASAPNRDPRGWTVSVVFAGFAGSNPLKPEAGDDAASAVWHSVNNLPKLAFDHDEITTKFLELLRNRILHGEFLDNLLPEEFTRKTLHILLVELFRNETLANEIAEAYFSNGLLETDNDVVKFNLYRLEKYRLQGMIAINLHNPQYGL